MSRFTEIVNEGLEKKVKNMAIELGIKAQGISVEVRGLKKSKKDIGIVVKSNDIVEIFTNDPSIVVVALYEKAFERVDSETQDIWIKSLLSQIFYDGEKDKISIVKPELNVSLGLYHQLGNIATQKAELALLTLQQIATEEEEERRAKKEKKHAKMKINGIVK